MGGHRQRVGVLAWNSHVLCSGGRDKGIFLRDPRAQEDFVARLVGHKSEARGANDWEISYLVGGWMPEGCLRRLRQRAALDSLRAAVFAALSPGFAPRLGAVGRSNTEARAATPHLHSLSLTAPPHLPSSTSRVRGDRCAA